MHKSKEWDSSLYIGILCLTVLCTHCFFNKLKVLWQPCTNQVYWHYFSNSIHSVVSLCYVWVILIIFQTFPLLLYLVWWSVTYTLWCYSDVTALGHHQPCPYKTTNLLSWVLTASLTGHFPISLSTPGAFLFPETHNIEIRPINISTLASKCLSERKSMYASNFTALF